MTKPISQTEARRLKRQVAALTETIKQMHNRYSQNYPGGTHFVTLDLLPDELLKIETAVKLNHHLIAKYDNCTGLRLYAVRNPQ